MDSFAGYVSSLDAPATHAETIDPGSPPVDVELSHVSRFIYVGFAGNLHVRMAGGEDAVFANVPAGTTLAVRVSHVLAELTSAGLILAKW